MGTCCTPSLDIVALRTAALLLDACLFIQLCRAANSWLHTMLHSTIYAANSASPKLRKTKTDPAHDRKGAQISILRYEAVVRMHQARENAHPPKKMPRARASLMLAAKSKYVHGLGSSKAQSMPSLHLNACLNAWQGGSAHPVPMPSTHQGLLRWTWPSYQRLDCTIAH